MTKFFLVESLYKYDFERQSSMHNEYPKLRITISTIFTFHMHKLEILPGGKKTVRNLLLKSLLVL